MSKKATNAKSATPEVDNQALDDPDMSDFIDDEDAEIDKPIPRMKRKHQRKVIGAMIVSPVQRSVLGNGVLGKPVQQKILSEEDKIRKWNEQSMKMFPHVRLAIIKAMSILLSEDMLNIIYRDIKWCYYYGKLNERYELVDALFLEPYSAHIPELEPIREYLKHMPRTYMKMVDTQTIVKQIELVKKSSRPASDALTRAQVAITHFDIKDTDAFWKPFPSSTRENDCLCL